MKKEKKRRACRARKLGHNSSCSKVCVEGGGWRANFVIAFGLALA
jgi:hypothetical protein